jgi:hypothetical protein
MTRETIALAVAAWFLLAICVFLGYGRLFVHNGVADVDRAKQRIDHCRTKEEIHAILGRSNSIQQEGKL